MYQFKATLDIIGINPFVSIPERILTGIFKQAAKNKGPIPICGTVNGHPFKQTLVKYGGNWRLYINTTMLKNSPNRIGEQIKIAVEFDPRDRTISPHPLLIEALSKNQDAKAAFEKLSPSRQKEIVRYIASLKSAKSVEKNIARAIDFLRGKGRFVGSQLR
ncbi:MAG: hypothetical protein C5B59_16235 [Bacteroidetes bacterium]|nr:MAG: hypothetical protein C5B59_16235 [Bacteroidota bacterium]